MLRDAIKRSDVDAVTLVHSETSTGALAPLADLAKAVLEFGDVMLLVDAVTSAAGSPVETDAWKLDFVFTGSQKALALAPGLALGVASPRMLERAKSIAERGAYLDLVAYDEAAAEAQPTNTPAIGLLFSLDAQLKRIEQEGGIEARWRRHDAMRQVVERWAENAGAGLGVTYLPPAGRRSWTVSCLKLPEGKTAKAVVDAAKKEGWTIGSGYGKLKDTTIRIGHMGDHTPARVTELLGVIERALR
jgi:aspartate aminotransferase-like enzyme